MKRTPEEQYLHELIESYVAPLRNEIRDLRQQLATIIIKKCCLDPHNRKFKASENGMEWYCSECNNLIEV